MRTLGQKLAAVGACLAGDPPELVAARLDFTAEEVVRWRDLARSRLEGALAYTGEDGELPSLESVAAAANFVRFPLRLVANTNTAACFFCAAYLGRNDVAFVHAAGARRITLIDLDIQKMNQMEAIYPNVREVIRGGAFATAEGMLAEGRRFDLVVCDPWGGATVRMATDAFELFYGLVNNYFLFGMTKEALEQIGAELRAESVEEAMRKLHGDIRLVAFLQRPNTDVYWVGVAARKFNGSEDFEIWRKQWLRLDHSLWRFR